MGFQRISVSFVMVMTKLGFFRKSSSIANLQNKTSKILSWISEGFGFIRDGNDWAEILSRVFCIRLD